MVFLQINAFYNEYQQASVWLLAYIFVNVPDQSACFLSLYHLGMCERFLEHYHHYIHM